MKIKLYTLYKEGIPKDKQGNITHNDSNTLCLFIFICYLDHFGKLYNCRKLIFMRWTEWGQGFGFFCARQLDEIFWLYFAERYTKRMLELLMSAYSTISVQDTALFLGMNENDATNCKLYIIYIFFN